MAKDPILAQKKAAKKIILNTLGYFPDRSYTRNALCAMVQTDVNRRLAFEVIAELEASKKIVQVSTEKFGIKTNERKSKAEPKNPKLRSKTQQDSE